MASDNKYIVTKPWGSRKRGQILPESREVRRKLAEGGCVVEYSDKVYSEMQAESKKKAEERKELKKAKMQGNKVETKMQPETAKNKGAK